MHKAAEGETLEERKQDVFWRHVKKGRGCWEWTSARLPKGYGKFSLRDNGETLQFYAHRASYEIHHGPIPDGMHVLHTCDNPPCVNPAHIYLGTQADNARDMLERGLHNAQSDEKQELYDSIRYDYVSTPMTVSQLAKKYDVSGAMIRSAVAARNKHDDGPEDEERYRRLVARKKALYGYAGKINGMDAIWIRKMYATGKFTIFDLADMYDVDFSYISYIVNGKRKKALNDLDPIFLTYVKVAMRSPGDWVDISYGL